jgi:hypothetical protein
MRSDAKARVVPQTLRETLGDDLCALIEGLTSGIRDIAPITSLSARRSSRASFRIALEDGSVVKGRRLDSRFEAERLTRLSRHLCLPLIPAVIAQHGTAVIEPWTEGRSLIDLSPTELQACGLCSDRSTPLLFCRVRMRISRSQAASGRRGWRTTCAV